MINKLFILLVYIINIINFPQLNNIYYIYNFFSHYSFSKIPQAPIPDPIHILTTPNFLLVLFISGNKVAIYLAPVAPNGWPRAMAPPFVLTLFISIPSLSMQYVAWLAKASFISKMSISLTDNPLFYKAFGIATDGPIPITLGGHPATE